MTRHCGVRDKNIITVLKKTDIQQLRAKKHKNF